MKRYPNATEVVWCQEEPQNQGAWYQTAHYFRENMRDDQKLYYAGRPASASPAGGYMARHNERQKALVEQAFGKLQVAFQLNPARYAPGFSQPGGSSAEAGEELNGRSRWHRRSEGAAIVGVGRRGDAARLAQEGRRAGLARREPDRHRDRQGRARAAGARGRRAGEDHQEGDGDSVGSGDVIAQIDTEGKAAAAAPAHGEARCSPAPGHKPQDRSAA